MIMNYSSNETLLLQIHEFNTRLKALGLVTYKTSIFLNQSSDHDKLSLQSTTYSSNIMLARDGSRKQNTRFLVGFDTQEIYLCSRKQSI